MSNVLAFERRPDALAFAPGVVPFDRTNPAHVRAWNSLFAFAAVEARHQQQEQERGR